MMRMSIIRRQFSKNRFPQILLLALLAFGILIKPVLFSMGEMHELQHDPKAAISHVDLDASHDGNAQDSGQDDRTNASALHTLTHFAHHCEQPTCTEAGCFASLDAALGRVHIPTPGESHRKSAIPATLFRPPISV